MARKDSLPASFLLSAIIFALTTTGDGTRSNIGWRCHTCRPGYFVAQQCTAMFGTQCARCPAGTYTDYFNTLYRCKPCSSCPLGHRLQVPCNREHDIKCILSTLLEHLHGTPDYQGDEPAKSDDSVTQPAIEDGSGELTEQKGSQFSNIFSNENGGQNKFFDIPGLSKIPKNLGEPYQEELSGDSPIKPHLFGMNSFETHVIRINKSAEVPTIRPTLFTFGIPEEATTTVVLPDKEAHIDHLLPLQETKDEANVMTSTIDNAIEGSAMSTITPEEHIKTTAGIPIQPKMADSEIQNPAEIQPEMVESELSTSNPIQVGITENGAPISVTNQAEVESPLLTQSPVRLLPQIYNGRAKALVDTFSDIEGSIKQSVPRFDLSAAVDPITAETTTTFSSSVAQAFTDVAEATISTQVEITSTSGQIATDPVIPESEEAGSETDNLGTTETDIPHLVTEGGTADPSLPSSSTLVPDVEDNIDGAEAETTSTVPLKKMIVPFVETMDEEAATASNKTPVARIIPLEGVDEDEPLHVTSVATEVESSSKEIESIPSDEDTDVPVLTTPEQTYPMGNGSELLQEPAADTASTEGHRHMDIVIAVVITGIGLIVLAVLAIRYFVKKRTFKDMRRSQRIQTNEEDGLKRIDSQGDDGFQTTIYDDVELQTVNGGRSNHYKGKANGHCADVNVSSPSNNEIMSAINCNYRPTMTTASDKNAVSNGDAYSVPNKLVISEPAEPLLNGKPLATDSADTTATHGFQSLALLDTLKFMDETTDEEAECIPTRLYVRRAIDDERYSEEARLVNHTPNMNAIADESTPMLTRLSECDS